MDLVVYALALPSALLLSSAWLLSPYVYFLDLLVSQQILIVWWCVLVVIIAGVFQRWRAALAVILLIALAGYPLVQNRMVIVPEVDFGSKPDGVVRIVSCNVNPQNEHWEHAVSDLLDLDADVVVLIEVPPDLSRTIRKQGWISDDSYTHWAHRFWVDQETSPGYILSRSPIEQVDLGLDPASAQQVLHVRVDHPSGGFIAGLIHPFSPRDRDRWAFGNRITRLQAQAVQQSYSEFGRPIVLGVDLNAGLAQDRARVLRSVGLRPSKPMTRVGGTFPSNTSVPDVLSLQIDDVWMLGDVRAHAWSTIDVLGSDHRAVVVDILLD